MRIHPSSLRTIFDPKVGELLVVLHHFCCHIVELFLDRNDATLLCCMRHAARDFTHKDRLESWLHCNLGVIFDLNDQHIALSVNKILPTALGVVNLLGNGLGHEYGDFCQNNVPIVCLTYARGAS